jgi:hypothetical protein
MTMIVSVTHLSRSVKRYKSYSLHRKLKVSVKFIRKIIVRFAYLCQFTITSLLQVNNIIFCR